MLLDQSPDSDSPEEHVDRMPSISFGWQTDESDSLSGVRHYNTIHMARAFTHHYFVLLATPVAPKRRTPKWPARQVYEREQKILHALLYPPSTLLQTVWWCVVLLV